jgi:hypothetical protein
MWTAYRLFGERCFDDFASMRDALEAEVAALDPAGNTRDAARRLRATMFSRAGVADTDAPKG